MHAPERPLPVPAPATSRDQWLALGVAALGLATRLPYVSADEGWFDEIFSIYTAAQPVGDIIRGALTEQTNPPGFYLLAALWGAIGGTGVPWHRLLVAVCGGLAPAVLTLAARRLGLSRWTAGVAGVLAVAAPYLWQMSLEIRAYAPLALLTCIALWLAAGLATGATAPAGRTLWSLAAVHVGMVLLHYFAAFSVFGLSVGVALAARARHRLSWGASVRIALVLGLPAALVLAAWLATALLGFGGMGGRNVAWIPDVPAWTAARQIPGLVLATAGTYGRWLSNALLLTGVAVVLAWSRRPGPSADDRRTAGVVLLFGALVPVALAWALHVSGLRNLWVARYLTGFLPGLALVAAVVVEAAAPRARRVLALGIGLWWLVAGWGFFQGRWPKPDWTTLLATLAPEGRATICADGSFVGLPFIYHARAQGLDGIVVVNAAACTPGAGRTWLVYDVERSGVVAPPEVPGLVLGPRIALFRGMQNLDARRVIARVAPPPVAPR